jgi:hypothetical protein
MTSDDGFLDNLARLGELEFRARTSGIMHAPAGANDAAAAAQKSAVPDNSVFLARALDSLARLDSHDIRRTRTIAFIPPPVENDSADVDAQERLADLAGPTETMTPPAPADDPVAAPKPGLPDGSAAHVSSGATSDTATTPALVPTASGTPDRLSDLARGVTIGRAPFDYQAALMGMIETASSDPGQLRSLVYEFARKTLKREVWRNQSLTPEEVGDCLSALETAIERVESDLSGGHSGGAVLPRLPTNLVQSRGEPGIGDHEAPPLRMLEHRSRARAPSAVGTGSEGAAEETWERGRFLAAPEPTSSERDRWSPAPERALSARAKAPPQVEIVYPERNNPQERLRRRVWLWFIVWPFIQLAGPIALTVGAYLVLTGRLGHQAPPPSPAAKQPEAAATYAEPPTRTASGLPLPSSYGVYAVSNGALSPLATLPIKAPDPRVMLSAEISKPSTTMLPDGKIAFVVFRRDLLNNAPQKASVRVVARVSRAMTFSNGKAMSVDVQGTWRIRSNSYEFSVAPLPEDREMISLRPVAPDFVFPAGRYALVLDGSAYDFTVEGVIKDPIQCLESVAAVTGAVYAECGPSR